MEKGGGGGGTRPGGGGFRPGESNVHEIRIGSPERPGEKRETMYFGNRRRGGGSPLGTAVVGVIFAGVGGISVLQSPIGWAFVLIGVLLIVFAVYSIMRPRQPMQPMPQPYGMPSVQQQQTTMQQPQQPQGPPPAQPPPFGQPPVQ